MGQSYGSAAYGVEEALSQIGSEFARAAEFDEEVADRKADDTAMETSLKAADANITKALNAEKDARVADNAELTKAVNDETVARTAGDAAINKLIATEVAARKNNDDSITTALNSEIANRVAGDESLVELITNEAAALNTSIDTLTTALSKEVSDRETAISSHEHSSLVSGTQSFVLDPTDGTATCTGDIATFSDIKLKTDLKQITDPLIKLSQLTGYNFYRDDLGRRQDGLIANDILKVLPDSVRNSPAAFLTVYYNGVIALLVEGVNELTKEVTSLKKQLEELTSKG